MSYASAQDIYDRFGQTEIEQAADRDNSDNADLIADAIATALASGKADIDGYLQGIYDLPLTATPALLVSLNVDLARYYLAGSTITEDIETIYKNTRRRLEFIQAGKIKLDIPKEAGTDGPVYVSAPSVFDFGGRR